MSERTEEIQQTRDIALITLARLAESRDTETGQHLERIAEYSRVLGEALRSSPHGNRIDEQFIEHLFKSSPLHDIGKVGIPDAILRKPGRLSEAEYAIMRTHTTIGGDTLRSVMDQFESHAFLGMAMEIIYAHHEKWDGSGYPKGLAGEMIPLSARIVALADAYDAITSKRSYKEGYAHEEAVRRIGKDRGTHFDPLVVDAFLACQAELLRIDAIGDPILAIDVRNYRVLMANRAAREIGLGRRISTGGPVIRSCIAFIERLRARETKTFAR